MIKVVYPKIQPEIKSENGKEFIFCTARKKWVILSPEEWVRQHFLLFLTNKCGYSPAVIAVERLVMVGELKQRFDIVVFDKDAKPYIIVECKEMEAPLNENTLMQVLRYNINMQAPYFVITNGTTTYAFARSDTGFKELSNFPGYEK